MKSKQEKKGEMKSKKPPIIPEDDDFLTIDEFNLVEEWLGQPRLYQKYSRIYATCIRKRDEANSNLKLVHAELGMQIRDNPSRFGITKPTNDAVDEARTSHPTYQNAVATLNKAEYNVTLLKGTCDALQHRRVALENLVKLRGSELHAEPRAEKEEDKEYLDRAAKKALRNRK